MSGRRNSYGSGDDAVVVSSGDERDEGQPQPQQQPAPQRSQSTSQRPKRRSTQHPVDYTSEHILGSVPEPPRRRRKKTSSSSSSEDSPTESSEAESDDQWQVPARVEADLAAAAAAAHAQAIEDANPNQISPALAEALLTALERVGYNRWEMMRATLDRKRLSPRDLAICERMTDETLKFFSLGAIKQHLLAKPVGVGGAERGATHSDPRNRTIQQLRVLSSLPILRDAEALIGRYQSLRSEELQREAERKRAEQAVLDQKRLQEQAAQAAMMASQHLAMQQQAWQMAMGVGFMSPQTQLLMQHQQQQLQQQQQQQQWQSQQQQQAQQQRQQVATPAMLVGTPASTDLSVIRLSACASCGDATRQQSKCGACNTVVYCSRPCQLADWKAKHKLVCATRAKDAVLQKAATEAAMVLAEQTKKEKSVVAAVAAPKEAVKTVDTDVVVVSAKVANAVATAPSACPLGCVLPPDGADIPCEIIGESTHRNPRYLVHWKGFSRDVSHDDVTEQERGPWDDTWPELSERWRKHKAELNKAIEPPKKKGSRLSDRVKIEGEPCEEIVSKLTKVTSHSDTETDVPAASSSAAPAETEPTSTSDATIEAVVVEAPVAVAEEAPIKSGDEPIAPSEEAAPVSAAEPAASSAALDLVFVPKAVTDPTDEEANLQLGLKSFQDLPYYWRRKLHVARESNGPFPVVSGVTPQRALLQQQLDAVRLVWQMPAMIEALLTGRWDHKTDAATVVPGGALVPTESVAEVAAAPASEAADVQDEVQGEPSRPEGEGEVPAGAVAPAAAEKEPEAEKELEKEPEKEPEAENETEKEPATTIAAEPTETAEETVEDAVEDVDVVVTSGDDSDDPDDHYIAPLLQRQQQAAKLAAASAPPVPEAPPAPPAAPIDPALFLSSNLPLGEVHVMELLGHTGYVPRDVEEPPSLVELLGSIPIDPSLTTAAMVKRTQTKSARNTFLQVLEQQHVLQNFVSHDSNGWSASIPLPAGRKQNGSEMPTWWNATEASLESGRLVQDATYPHDAQLLLVTYLWGQERMKCGRLMDAMMKAPWLTLHKVVGRTVVFSELIEDPHWQPIPNVPREAQLPPSKVLVDRSVVISTIKSRAILARLKWLTQQLTNLLDGVLPNGYRPPLSREQVDAARTRKLPPIAIRPLEQVDVVRKDTDLPRTAQLEDYLSFTFQRDQIRAVLAALAREKEAAAARRAAAEKAALERAKAEAQARADALAAAKRAQMEAQAARDRDRALEMARKRQREQELQARQAQEASERRARERQQAQNLEFEQRSRAVAAMRKSEEAQRQKATALWSKQAFSSRNGESSDASNAAAVAAAALAAKQQAWAADLAASTAETERENAALQQEIEQQLATKKRLAEQRAELLRKKKALLEEENAQQEQELQEQERTELAELEARKKARLQSAAKARKRSAAELEAESAVSSAPSSPAPSAKKRSPASGSPAGKKQKVSDLPRSPAAKAQKRKADAESEEETAAAVAADSDADSSSSEEAPPSAAELKALRAARKAARNAEQTSARTREEERRKAAKSEAEKEHVCSNCSRSFRTAATRRTHEDICGPTKTSSKKKKNKKQAASEEDQECKDASAPASAASSRASSPAPNPPAKRAKNTPGKATRATAAAIAPASDDDAMEE